MKFGVVLDIGESIDDVQLTKKNKKFCVARNERGCSGYPFGQLTEVRGVIYYILYTIKKSWG